MANCIFFDSDTELKVLDVTGQRDCIDFPSNQNINLNVRYFRHEYCIVDLSTARFYVVYIRHGVTLGVPLESMDHLLKAFNINPIGSYANETRS